MEDLLQDPNVQRALQSLMVLGITAAVGIISSMVERWKAKRRDTGRDKLLGIAIAAVEEVFQENVRPRKEAVEDPNQDVSPITAKEKLHYNNLACTKINDMAHSEGLDLKKVLGSAARRKLPALVSYAVKIAKGLASRSLGIPL